MTPKDLTQARANEAVRRYLAISPNPPLGKLTDIYEELIDTDWTPTPTEADLCVRELRAKRYEKQGYEGSAASMRAGVYDTNEEHIIGVQAYNAGLAARPDAPSINASVEAAYEYALPFSHHVEARVDAHLAGQTYNAELLDEAAGLLREAHEWIRSHGTPNLLARITAFLAKLGVK